jgi:hypothetical protein
MASPMMGGILHQSQDVPELVKRAYPLHRPGRDVQDGLPVDQLSFQLDDSWLPTGPGGGTSPVILGQGI